MIKTFLIYTSPDSYTASNGKTKDIGEIYIQLDDYAFPEKGWTDFGRDIVFWWIEAFIKLFRREEKKVKCSFMDGNYRFDIKVTDSPEIWHISLIREWSDVEEVEKESEINIKQATQSIVQTARLFADLDRKNGDEKSANSYDMRIQILLNLMQKNQ